MAINTNITRMVSAVGRPGVTGVSGGGGEVRPPAPPPATTPAQPLAQPMTAMNPNVIATAVPIRPIIPDLVRPLPFPTIPIFSPEKTTTQIAQGAISLLSGANQSIVQEAVNTAKNRNVAAGSLMNYLERKVKIGEVLSELAARFNRYAASGEINTLVDDQKLIMDKVAAAFADRGVQDRLDGLTVAGDDWWVNVRPSNTEPLLRLNVEADTEATMVSLRDEVLGMVRG